MGVKSVPLGSLGLNGLLQLQAQQVDVSKELRGLGRADLISYVEKTKPGEKGVATTMRAPGNKYNVSPKDQRTEDNIVFDSKLERAAYVMLRDRGVDFDLHPVYELQEKFTDVLGEKHRAIAYEADFLIRDGKGGEYIVDMKGMETPEFRLKRKLFLFKYQKSLYCFKTVGGLLTLILEKGAAKKEHNAS